MDLPDPISPLPPNHARQGRRSGLGAANFGGEQISYDDEYVKLNSSLQVAWNESLNPDVFTTSTTYRKVEVLMLSWEPEFDDLKVQGEINDLKNVFETRFHFHVTSKHLTRDRKRKAQQQMNKIVAMWVAETDSRQTLLIVYFAGHGRPNKKGGLEIAGHHKSPSDLRDYLDKVVWNMTEHNLQALDADLLQIFDCCHAGTIETRGSDSGASEFLAATGANSTTPKPGKSSFTSALIWALKELAERKRPFTTTDLSSKITEAPDFPPQQKPVLFKRGDDHFREQQLIVLEPLRSNMSQAPTTPLSAGSVKHEGSNRDVMTLKFVFTTRPDESDIRKIGEDMNHLVARNNLKINRIIFGGIWPDMVLLAVSKFRALGRRQSKRNSTSDVADLMQNITDEVEKNVLGRINEHSDLCVQGSVEDFVAHTSARRARDRDS
jgi:Caspase domain